MARDKPFVTSHSRDHRDAKAGQKVMIVLYIHTLGESHRADQVAEYDCKLPMLSTCMLTLSRLQMLGRVGRRVEQWAAE
jgi:hypothetical protein